MTEPKAPHLGGPAAIRHALERLSLIGVTAADSDDIRLQKVTLTLSAITVTVLAIGWVGTYLALGLPVSAAIPFTYQVASMVTPDRFGRTKDYRFFRFSQIVLIFLLPFLLQWSLGGYVASSAVSLWALVGALRRALLLQPSRGRPVVRRVRRADVVSGLVDRRGSPRAPRRSRPRSRRPSSSSTSWASSVTAYLLLQYAVRARDAALAQLRGPAAQCPAAVDRRAAEARAGVIAERHDDVTVLFADVVDFTPFAERTDARARRRRARRDLQRVRPAGRARIGLEKIKTIGDAYMVAGGLPEPRPDHAEAVADDGASTMQAEFGRASHRASWMATWRSGSGSTAGPWSPASSGDASSSTTCGATR